MASKFHTLYNPPDDCKATNDKASVTLQEFAEETDLNRIMDKYAAGMGTLPVRAGTPIFGDFSNIPDFATAQQIVVDAREKFESLPSRLRERFGNDPAQLLDFLRDEKNRSEAVELGLIPSKQKASGASIGGGIDAVAEDKSVPSDNGKGGADA